MKKIFLVCSNIIILTLFLIVASKNNSEFVDLDKKEYSKVFSHEITGNLTNQNKFVEDIVLNTDNKEVLRWGIRRNKDHNIPYADPGAPELLKKYNSYYIGDTNSKKIYLTFDEGYENGYTGNILDTLKNENVKAVFFITGPYLNDHSELVERMLKEGHCVGNHTVNHSSLPTISDQMVKDEVKKLENNFYEKFREHMIFHRAPKGEYSERTLKITNDLGYINVFWSLAYDDWYKDKIRGKEYAHRIITNNLHNGAIILLHAVSKDNADALEDIIKSARDMGYEFGDLKKDFVRK